jgi:flagellar hook-associated protein 1
LGADIALRDTTLPTFQGELDEFSNSLASQFSAQGLTLFSDPNGNVPAGGGTPVQSTYVGFSAEIQVNPLVIATPSMVRDGTQSVAGSATGASAFTINPAGGPAGFTTLISRAAPATLGDAATALVSAQAAVSAAATSQLGTELTVQTALSNNMSAASGVNMDTEMSYMIELQNAYGVNARIISTVQDMFTQLLSVVQ